MSILNVSSHSKPENSEAVQAYIENDNEAERGVDSEHSDFDNLQTGTIPLSTSEF